MSYTIGTAMVPTRTHAMTHAQLYYELRRMGMSRDTARGIIETETLHMGTKDRLMYWFRLLKYTR